MSAPVRTGWSRYRRRIVRLLSAYGVHGVTHQAGVVKVSRLPPLPRVKCPAQSKLSTMTIPTLTKRGSIYDHNADGFHIFTRTKDGKKKKGTKRVPHAVSRDHFFQCQLQAYLADADMIIYAVWTKAKTLRSVTQIAGHTPASSRGATFATPEGCIQIFQLPVERQWMREFALPKAREFWEEKLLRHTVLLESGFFKKRGEVEDSIDPWLIAEERYDEPRSSSDVDESDPGDEMDVAAASADPTPSAATRKLPKGKEKEPPFLPPPPKVAAFFPVSKKITPAFVRYEGGFPPPPHTHTPKIHRADAMLLQS